MKKINTLLLVTFLFALPSCFEESIKVGDCVKPADNGQLWIVRIMGSSKPLKGEIVHDGKVFEGHTGMNELVDWVKVDCPEAVQ